MGAGARVVAVRRLVGGVTAAMHRLTVVDSHGGTRDVVLRRWVGAVAAAAAASVRRESRALAGLVGNGIPAPELLATDDSGAEAGVPATLTTVLPGAVLLLPADRDDWLRQLASMLVRIHATAVPAEPAVSWVNLSEEPAWVAASDLWRQARQVAREPSEGQQSFIHRDYQHFNVLWQDQKLSAVVDWADAATGPRGLDVGHCRLNLAVLFSAETAEKFLRLYESEAGCRVDPRADITALCSFDHHWPNFIPHQVASRAPVDAPGMRPRVEEVLRVALRRL